MTESKVPYLISSFLYGVRHGFFTRQGGVSTGLLSSLNCSLRETDDPKNVFKNRALAMEALGMPANSLQTLRQEHGNKAIELTEPWGQGEEVPIADAVVTKRTDVTLGIQTGDCVPVLIADPENKIIGAVHAGWRSALSGVIQNTLELMQKRGADFATTVAVIGPCIHQDSYEVGSELRDAFLQKDETNEQFFLEQYTPSKILFDLPGYVKHQLEKFNLQTVEVLPYDTYENEDLFFSCRRAFHRQEEIFGCHLSAISLKGL
ncbi:MAG: peptidoglycan editing factor PgeF [Alphaproteobacteria bacterium]